ncbi:ExbD/TolR family protein [Roseiconus lacunae]|uniref:Biopolymer transporter ExbD n=1 Tax=Roseiconus lacunae TaxID=2605694 RepID=A0ABT7PFT5_9BACT|nr:biopolymer transporter ExbD [Roseiconus lacunae]MCD0461453.1 biopolymer transporter ExbD [Roseiconus lacunae]MDM4015352.1 biopolymer transporter ExbD [Roseiconus lacunae]WRQ52970.1 biopolymer transporter ExbD [Stieleria sp. HD01]
MADDLIDDDGDDDFAMPRKNRDSEEMDITPMIDITFLLLIFFVVCSKMDPTQMGDIPEAANGVAISAKDSAVVFIESAGKDKVVVKRVNGTEFSDDEELQTAELVEYVTEELKSTVGREKNHVMIMGDAEVKVGEVTRIQKIIGDAFEDISSTYIAVKEL